MKRYMLWSMFALAAIALVVLPSVATANEQPFAVSSTLTFQEHDGYYYVYSGPASGTLVGNGWQESRVHFEGKKLQSEVTITAANGDQVFMECAQAFDGTAWSGSFTIVGGTGRFEGASGSGIVSATLNPDFTVSGVFDGTIGF